VYEPVKKVTAIQGDSLVDATPGIVLVDNLDQKV